MKKNNKKIIITLAVSVLCLAAALFFALNTHYLYIFGEALGVNCEKVELNETTPPELEKASIEALRSDGRVVFDQSGMLVNAENPISDENAPSLSEYKDTGVVMNDCVREAYGKLSAAVRENTGTRLLISSSYRTQEEQEALYAEDPSTANLPGTSEHQTGLALDVYVKFYAGFGFVKSDAGRFMNSNCWKYGFIIRYPVYGKNETGMKYEPWHIRYVGEPHAKIIYNNHLTLEEYVRLLGEGKWYETEGYLISRQKASADGELSLPKNFSSAIISSDNAGGYIITLSIE